MIGSHEPRMSAGRAGEEGEVRVTARGPAEVDFERTGSAEQGALFTTAGSYLVCAALGGRLLAGAPLAGLTSIQLDKMTCRGQIVLLIL